MICVRTGDDWFEIHILAGLLEAHDIPCAVLHAEMVRMDWSMAQALGGYRLVAQRSMAAEAFELLAAFERGELATDKAPACPYCGGERLVRINSPARRIGMLGLLLFEPLVLLVPLMAPWSEDRLLCRACGRYDTLPVEPHCDVVPA